MTNNDILKQIMVKHDINHVKLAEVLMLSPGYVRHYTMLPELEGFRYFSDRNLKMLKRFVGKRSITTPNNQ